MADKNRYPQIPSTVWWGLRSILQRTPTAKIDERFLGVQLGVQETAARAYINELRSVGLIDEEGRATNLAQEWRLDDTYQNAVGELVASNYPEGLIHVAPPGEADRQKVVSWFQREGLGSGAAGNKAATYLMISSPTPNDAAKVPAKAGTDGAKAPKVPREVARAERAPKLAAKTLPTKAATGKQQRQGVDAMPLNINIQIHISADAGSEQIESIFQAMRRYLYDASGS